LAKLTLFGFEGTPSKEKVDEKRVAQGGEIASTGGVPIVRRGCE